MIVLKKEDIRNIVEQLKAGQTVVFPTETSYGLGCDATNRDAVEKIFKIKNREWNKLLLVVVPSIKMAKKYLKWNVTLQNLARKYWPGPLTVVGDYRHHNWFGNNLVIGVVSEQKTIAVRITADPFLKEITKRLGQPLVATSANLSGDGEIYSAEEIKTIFSSRPSSPDILVDGGELKRNKPTTLVSVLGNDLKILREGEIKVEI